MEQKPSEVIKAFLALVEQSHTEYSNSKGKVDYFNKHTYELVHMLEDCPDETLFTLPDSGGRKRRTGARNGIIWRCGRTFISLGAAKITSLF